MTDEIYVLRTNSRLSILAVALAYRKLNSGKWRPFSDGEINPGNAPDLSPMRRRQRRHLFCSFLALLLRKELDEQLVTAGVEAEWGDIVRDLDRVEQITVEQGTKRFVLRPHAPGCAGSVFKAVGVALPPLVHQLPPATPPPRRRRPQRGATRPEFVRVTLQINKFWHTLAWSLPAVNWT